MNILGGYHEALLEKGVTNYSFAQCVADYKLSILYPMLMVIDVGAWADLSTERGTYLMKLIFKHVAAMLDALDRVS